VASITKYFTYQYIAIYLMLNAFKKSLGPFIAKYIAAINKAIKRFLIIIRVMNVKASLSGTQIDN